MNIKYICAACGKKIVEFFGKKVKDRVSTFHSSKCEVCNEEGVGVTNVRNYGYLYVNRYVWGLKTEEDYK